MTPKDQIVSKKSALNVYRMESYNNRFKKNTIEDKATVSMNATVLQFKTGRKKMASPQCLKNKIKGALKNGSFFHEFSLNGDETELRFDTDYLKGYAEITELKMDLYMISGHLETKLADSEVRLMLPNGALIDNLERDDQYWLFRTFTKQRVPLSDIRYEVQ